MSRPLKKTPKKDARKARAAKLFKLPDRQAIRKLFPSKLIDEIDKAIGKPKKS